MQHRTCMLSLQNRTNKNKNDYYNTRKDLVYFVFAFELLPYSPIPKPQNILLNTEILLRSIWSQSATGLGYKMG